MFALALAGALLTFRETVIGTVIRITANLEPAPLCNLSDYSKK